MKRFVLIVLTVLFTFAFSNEVAFAKTLPQAKSAKPAIKKTATGGNVTVSARLRADRKALNVTFGNLLSATSVNYTLIYTQSGQEEGAGGSIKPDTSTVTRELLFGTCSKNVCRYHSNIKNMRLEVVSKLKSGKTSTKRFKINI